MGARLIICEKPSMARTVASAIGPMSRYDGYLEGSGYIVSWCYGHLYELDDLEQYKNPKFRKGDKARWNLQDLPFYPNGWEFRYSPRDDSGVKKQIRVLRNLMNRKDVDTIYAAGDADREGEVIVRLVIDQNLKTKKTVLRLWLRALTPDVIREALRDAKPDAEYDRLYQAGRARAAVDWLMGIELTRYATLRSGRLIRMGRCISPIVRRIVEREQEIRDFVPRKYLGIVSKQKVNGILLELTSRRTFDISDLGGAIYHAEKLNQSGALVISEQTSKTIVKRPKLFSMSDLQSCLCKRNKQLTPADVLAATQALYEKRYVTYPRTNSNYLTEGEAESVERILFAWGRERFPGLSSRREEKGIYDNSKVESHSAIIPTEKVPVGIDGIEKETYETILCRFLAVFCEEECMMNQTEVVILCGGEEFIVKGNSMIQPGWAVFESLEKKEKILPILSQEASFRIHFVPVEKETSPPKRYTVETLNAWMKAPFRGEDRNGDYTDAEWRDILSDATICTEATRSETLERCMRSKYIALKKGSYYALEDGVVLVETMKRLNIDLSAKRTAELSRRLYEITRGIATPAQVMEETKEFIDNIILMKNEEGKP